MYTTSKQAKRKMRPAQRQVKFTVCDCYGMPKSAPQIIPEDVADKKVMTYLQRDYTFAEELEIKQQGCFVLCSPVPHHLDSITDKSVYSLTEFIYYETI